MDMKILNRNFFVKNIRSYLIIMSPIIILQVLHIANIHEIFKEVIGVIELICIVYTTFGIPIILLIFGFKLANREKRYLFLNYFMVIVIMVSISNYLSSFGYAATWLDNVNRYDLDPFIRIISEMLNNFIVIMGGIVIQIILLVKRRRELNVVKNLNESGH